MSKAQSCSTLCPTPAALADAHERGVPVVVRAASADEVVRALARPEVACVLVPSAALLELDLPEITYGP